MAAARCVVSCGVSLTIQYIARGYQEDIIGLRQRLTVVYARPLFMEIGEIRQACHQLPEDLSWRPAPFVAALLFPLIALSLKKEAAVDTESAVDSTVGTVFYPAEDGARDLIDSKFNARNQKQKGCFLQPDSHHLSKYHGKLKTKYDRMLTNLWKEHKPPPRYIYGLHSMLLPFYVLEGALAHAPSFFFFFLSF